MSHIRFSSLVAAAALLTSACAAPAPAAQTAAPDRIAANRALAENVFAAFNRHDAAGMAAFYAPEIIMVTPEYCTPRQGIEAASQTHTDLFTQFPQLQDEVVEIVADEDTVAVQFIAHSTTPGREFDLPIVAIFQIRDGLIVHDQTYYDNRGQACTP